MPPITASSWCRRATRRCVILKRFITLACSRRSGWFAVRAMRPLLFLEDLAPGEQGREDEGDGRLGGDGLADGTVDDEFDLVETRQCVVLHREAVQHRAHGPRDERLTDVELPQ